MWVRSFAIRCSLIAYVLLALITGPGEERAKLSLADFLLLFRTAVMNGLFSAAQEGQDYFSEESVPILEF